jgi:hypothetical protein
MGKLFDVPTITCTIFKITIFNKTDSFYQKKKIDSFKINFNHCKTNTHLHE